MKSNSAFDRIPVGEPVGAEQRVHAWLAAHPHERVTEHEIVATERGGIELHVSHVTDDGADGNPTEYRSFIVMPGTDAAQQANEWLASSPWIFIESCNSIRMRDGASYLDFFFHDVNR